MTNKRHNNPPMILEIDDEMADFLEQNADSNIGTCLRILIELGSSEKDQALAEKVIGLNENFKKLKKLVINARKERNA